MTTEEKAKAWDEAVERAKSKIRNDKDHVLYEEDILDIFPSLKESEDERIRNFLVDFIKVCAWTEKTDQGWPTKDACIAWIEKQGEHANFRNKIQVGDKVTRNEDGVLVNLSQLNRVAKKQGGQKPAEQCNTNKEFSEAVSEKIRNMVSRLFNGDGNITSKEFADQFAWELLTLARYEIQKEQNPDEWSEDDEKMYTATIFALAGFMGNKDKLDWLKSLKERVQFQNTWKPSESDIRILEQVIDGTANPINYHATLHAILEKLKKLREK